MTERPAPPPELSVVVPFVDEEENLALYPAELFPALDALGLAWELVLVDDGSRDGSRRAAEELLRLRPGRLLVHEANRGLGAALRTGLAATRGALVVTLDADLTFHPRQVGALLERWRRGDVDLVLGAPDLGKGAPVERRRALTSAAANLLYRLVLGRRIAAVTPIFRLYRGELVRGLALESRGFEINAEVLAKLLFAGARVAEVDTLLTTRRHGVSKLSGLRETLRHLRLVARIARWRLAARRPAPRA